MTASQFPARDPIDFTLLPKADLADDGGRPLDAVLCVTPDLGWAVREAVRQGYAVMPAGGLTSAIGSFDYTPARVEGFTGVVAIRPRTAAVPESVAADTPIETLLSHQIAVDAEGGCVTTGAGLTFAQVNNVLAHAVGPNARVLIDLTSVGSAFAGGVVATGGMGPLRLRPSATLAAICIADGGEPRVATGDEIADYEGLQGWAGMITAVRMRIIEVPPLEFGLVLPIQSSDIDGIASLLAYLHDWANVEIGADGRLTGRIENTVLNGVELVSRDSLEQFIEHASDPARSKAMGLYQSCEYAGADMLACLTGWSDVPVDDVLAILLDEETETIGGVMIDFGVGFSSGAEMDTFRAIREGAPDLARTRARVKPPGKLRPWTTSTDVNVAAPKDSTALSNIFTVYDDYRQGIWELRDRMADRAEVSLAIYGHLSPQGIDPHMRVTVIAPEGGDADLAEARTAVTAMKKRLIADLVRVAGEVGCTITGGEKGAPSLIEIVRAVGGEANLPTPLQDSLARVRRVVLAAPRAFAFRAPLEILA